MSTDGHVDNMNTIISEIKRIKTDSEKKCIHLITYTLFFTLFSWDYIYENGDSSSIYENVYLNKIFATYTCFFAMVLLMLFFLLYPLFIESLIALINYNHEFLFLNT